MNQLPPEVLVKIIDTLFYILAGAAGIVGMVFAFFHKGILRQIDKVNTETRDCSTKVALLSQRSEDNTQKIAEQDKRISSLESKVK